MDNRKSIDNSAKWDFLTVRQAADILQIGLIKTYSLIKAGKIPSIKLGKAIRIPKKALEVWAEEQAEQSISKEVM